MSDGLEASRRRARRNVVLTAAIAGLGGLLFGYDVRSKAAGLGTMANWTFNFIVSLTFLLLSEALGRSGAFWFYGVIGLFTLAFCWKFVPETKGKRLEDIQDFFRDRVDSRKARA